MLVQYPTILMQNPMIPDRIRYSYNSCTGLKLGRCITRNKRKRLAKIFLPGQVEYCIHMLQLFITVLFLL